MENQHFRVKESIIFSFFIALIIILSFIPYLGFIDLIVTKATIIHIPVIIGSIILGPKKGAFLGFVFGLCSFLINTLTPSLTSFVFTPFYGDSNPFSLIVCFVPRILTGLLPYFIFKMFKKRSVSAYITTGFLGSLINTLFTLGFIALFFGDSYLSFFNFTSIFTLLFWLILIQGIPEALTASILVLFITRFIYNKILVLEV